MINSGVLTGWRGLWIQSEGCIEEEVMVRPRRLQIYEALLILHQRPDMNRQKDNFVNPLKLYSRYLPRPRHNPEISAPPSPPPRYNLRSGSRALSNQ